MARLSKEERRARRQERRAARKAAHLTGAPASEARVPTKKLGRKERRQARRDRRLEAALATRPKEPVERGPITRMIIGRKTQFTEAQLAHHNLHLARESWPGSWIVRWEGEDYVDCDVVNSKQEAERSIRWFSRNDAPKFEIIWL